jgi:hypothetical protein
MNSFANVKYFREVFGTLLMITDPPGIAGFRAGDGRPRRRAAAPAGLAAVAGRVRGGQRRGDSSAVVVVLPWLAMRFSGAIQRVRRDRGVAWAGVSRPV